MKNKLEIIYTELFDGINGDPIEFKKRWKSLGLGTNLDGINYRGINSLLCAMHIEKTGSSGIYGTYKAMQAKGLQVTKGEKACLSIVYFSTFETDKIDTKGKAKSVGYWRRYPVFSLEQAEGDKSQLTGNKLDFIDNGTIEAFVKSVGVKINHGGGQAYYSDTTNEITLPNKTHFDTIATYYATLFHELTHWSASITPRQCAKEYQENKQARAKEELVAEIGSAILARQFNLEPTLLDDHVSYIQSWIKALSDTPKEFHNAFTLATKAVDEINKRAEKLQENDPKFAEKVA